MQASRNYEEFWNHSFLLEREPQQYYPRSTGFNVGQNFNPDIGFGYINGMDTHYKDAEKFGIRMSNLLNGQQVNVVHNSTQGFLKDLTKCYFNLYGGIANEPVQYLHNAWDAFFAKASKEGFFVQTCFSQGAIHTRNALILYSEEKRKRINVIAFGPGAFINKELCMSVKHYCSNIDYVTYLDWKGRKMAKEQGTLFKLKREKGSSIIMDHESLSPTYLKPLDSDLLNFYYKYVSNYD